MRLRSSFIVALLAAGAAGIAGAQSTGWPKAMPLPPAGAPGTTQTIVQQTPPSPITAEQLAKRFQVAGNEVYDRKTDLTWQRCDFGQTWDESNGWCRGVKRHATIDGLGEAARSDAPGWRVPTLDELASLLEIACRAQAKDATPVFPEVEHGSGTTYYLTSTPSGTGEGIMAQQCFGTSPMPAGLGRKYTSVTHLVHSGAIAAH